MKPLTVSIIEKIEVTIKWVGDDCGLGFQFKGINYTGEDVKYAVHYSVKEMNPDKVDEMILTRLRELMDSRRKLELEVA